VSESGLEKRGVGEVGWKEPHGRGDSRMGKQARVCKNASFPPPCHESVRACMCPQISVSSALRT
jgi:hypothetical protein